MADYSATKMNKLLLHTIQLNLTDKIEIIHIKYRLNHAIYIKFKKRKLFSGASNQDSNYL